MTKLFEDLECVKTALEFYIIIEEDRLIETNAGDSEWEELRPFQTALQNINYLETIYG